MTKRVFFIDIDGTLTAYDDIIPEENLLAIDEARRRGHFVFLNTGRSPAFIPDTVKKHFDRFDGVVAGCGTNITVGGEVIHSKLLSKDILTRGAQFVLESGRTASFEGEDAVVFAVWEYCASIGAIRLEDKNDFNTRFSHMRINKFSVGGSLTPEQEALFADEMYFIGNEGYSEGIPLGHSKTQGMRAVLEKLGLTMENAVCIGDSNNDLDMVTAAGIGVAMGNACEALKNIADFVTLPNTEAGLAAAIRKLI